MGKMPGGRKRSAAGLEAYGSKLRRSDRVSLELSIEIGGSDARGMAFFEAARTTVVSRHGAKIATRRILSPNQEILISCRDTDRDAPARVVGDLGESDGGHFYGVAFLNDRTNLWDIVFPELTESERAEARALMECAACHLRKVTYLNAFEAEVLAFHRRLSFYCVRCADATIWRPVSARPSEMETVPPEPSLPPARTKEERIARRIQVRVSVCLRHPQLGEEVAETENLSRGGFAFKAKKFYTPNTVMEAALPYAPGQANIFCPVEVEHCEPAGETGGFLSGVSYIRIHHGWPGPDGDAVPKR